MEKRSKTDLALVVNPYPTCDGISLRLQFRCISAIALRNSLTKQSKMSYWNSDA